MSDDETTKPSAPPDIEAVRAERKAAKRQAQAERRAAKPAAAPEAQAERAQRKAAKRLAKEAKKTKTPDAEAAKAQRKAAKRQAQAQRRAAKPAAVPEAQAQRAERKAAKRQAKEVEKSKALDAETAKAERKTAKRQAKDAATAAREAKTAEALAARAERKTGKRQTQEAEKTQRKAAKPVASSEAQAQRAERKAAKHEAKETKKVKAPEVLAAKAERKAAKHQAKEVKKTKAPEELAAKAERKAAKQQAKEAKKTKAPEELAAKAERKAAKQQAKEAEKAKTPEDPAVKAERKAAKQAAKPEKSPDAKAERKAAKQQTKEAKKVRTPEDLAAKAERKAAKQQAKEAAPADAGKAEEKAAKKQAKAERKAAKAEKTPEEAAAKAERKAKKAVAKGDGAGDGLSHKEHKSSREAQKAEKRAAKAKAREEGGERSVRLNVAGASPEEVTPLGTALQAAFAAAGAPTEAPKPEGKADVVVHTFDDMGDDADAGTVERYAAAVAGQKARVHVFVEKLEEDGAVGRAIARLAALNGGAVVSTRARLKRFGLDETSASGRPNEKGLTLIAEAIVGIGAARLTKHSLNPQAGEVPADLSEARAAAERPMELLGKLRWSGMTPPRAIGASIHEEDVVAFADSKVVFSEEASLALATPVDWSVELPDRKANYIFNGLDFLSGPLAYWYAKANNQGSERTVAIDAALKERGTNPNALFARATQILVDFVVRHPRSAAPKLWEEELVLRRAPVLALFVLCCRVAFRRKLKFNESAFTAVFDALLDHAEILRADDFYVPCSVDGIKQDSLTIGIALSLRGTAYGSLLMSEALERLKRLQLDPGLSAEGVWLGDSYTTHNNALSEITGLFADFPPAETAMLEPLAAAAKKMTLFSEAMLKSNGQPPAFDGSKEKSYGNKISGMRKSIARAGGKQVSAGKAALKTRVTDTYVFREAQYFISHSQQTVIPESSLVVLHAAAPSVVHEDPGGVKLVFAYNETNLLVRATPPQAQGEEEPDEGDPGLRNFYRVAGQGNLAPESGSDKTARMVKSWRGPGWAAARAFEDSYDGASIARTVIHLKARHALIVVDELASEKQVLFEQFWNVGPDFTAPGTMEMPLRFASDGSGVLSVVLAGADGVSATKSETGTSLRGELLVTQDVAAALFQWTDEAADAALTIERRGAGEWAATASAKGFSARLNYAGSELTCELNEG